MRDDAGRANPPRRPLDFWREIEREILPAVRAGDAGRARQALDRADVAYERHRDRDRQGGAHGHQGRRGREGQVGASRRKLAFVLLAGGGALLLLVVVGGVTLLSRRDGASRSRP
jgi:methyl-accepting chemotaxis protein